MLLVFCDLKSGFSHSPALIFHSSRTSIQLGLFSSEYSLHFIVSHLTHTVQSGPRDVVESGDYVFKFLNSEMWLISETLQTVSQIQWGMFKEHPYTEFSLYEAA